jgi:hypothetical protein
VPRDALAGENASPSTPAPSTPSVPAPNPAPTPAPKPLPPVFQFKKYLEKTAEIDELIKQIDAKEREIDNELAIAKIKDHINTLT